MKNREINTCIISLNEYIDLKTFKEKMEANLICCDTPYNSYYYTESEAIENIKKDYDSEIKLLRDEIKELRQIKKKPFRLW